jgi:hypothetical protein
MSSSLDSDDDTTVSGSENSTANETNTDASTDTTIDSSFDDNVSDNDLIDTDVDVDAGSGHEAPMAVHESDGLWPTEDADAVVGLEPVDSVAD